MASPTSFSAVYIKNEVGWERGGSGGVGGGGGVTFVTPGWMPLSSMSF